MKKVITLLLAAVFLASGLAACGTADSGSQAASAPGSAAEPANGGAEGGDASGEEWASYTIGHNMLSAALQPFQVVVHESERALAFYGCTLVTADNEFSSDKVISDLQSQAASGVDGYEFICTYAALFEEACNVLTDAGVPFVLYDKIPATGETQVWDTYYASDMFMGAITANEYQTGYQMGTKAAEAGCSKVIIARSIVGDFSHDERQRGFEEAFVKENGGEILDIVYCDPPEATTKINDLMTANPGADCLYAAGGDWAEAAFSAIDSRGDWTAELKLYTSDFSVTMANRILDGSLQSCSGGQFALGAIANTLIINYLDGHQILDENGNVPVLIDILPYLELNQDNAQAYIDMVEAGDWIVPADAYRQCLYRYNPEAGVQDLIDLCTGYEAMWAQLG